MMPCSHPTWKGFIILLFNVDSLANKAQNIVPPLIRLIEAKTDLLIAQRIEQEYRNRNKQYRA